MLAALCDDLNTPDALAQLAALAGQARQATDPGDRAGAKRALLDAGALLGLLQQDPESWFTGARGDDQATAIDALVAQRQQARQARDFARADAIRDRSPRSAWWSKRVPKAPAGGGTGERPGAGGTAADRRGIRAVRGLERALPVPDRPRQAPAAVPDAWRDEAHRIHGCQSMVWLVAEGDASALTLHAGSDSVIVSGLIALVLRVYSGLSAADIVATEPDFIHAIGLGSHLSPTRSNGLAALLARVKALAGRAVDGEVLAAPPRLP